MTDAARNAAIATIRAAAGRPTLRRPSAPLGLYTSLYLAQQGFVPSTSAVAGVEAQAQFYRLQHPIQLEETFALLEEFGTVLQVDVADLLNRSQNRPETLNNYMEAFANITERARRKQADLSLAVDQLDTREKEAKAAVRALEKSIDAALEAADYATTGSLQQELTTAQTALAEVSSEHEQTEDILQTYEDLIELADRRRAAIEQNREILIAGLQVVDVPGIEDLGLIQQDPHSRRRTNTRRVLGL